MENQNAKISGIQAGITTIEGFKNQGKLFYNQKDYRNAEKMYSSGFELDQTDTILLCNRCLCRINIENYDGH